jgi:outer membrane protein, heavy metal efflux system
VILHNTPGAAFLTSSRGPRWFAFGLVAICCAGCGGLRNWARSESPLKDESTRPAVAKLSADSRRDAEASRRTLASATKSEPAPVKSVAESRTDETRVSTDSPLSRVVPKSVSPELAASKPKPSQARTRAGHGIRQVGHEIAEGTTTAKRWATQAPSIDDSEIADPPEEAPISVASAEEELGDSATSELAEADETRAPQRLSDRLKIPEELPGAAVPPLRLPKFDPENPQDRGRVIDGMFPALPQEQLDLARDNPQTLSDFEALALANNPLVTQAMADIESANGRAVQAGLYPNPVIGYQGDTIGSGGTANYHGVFIQQQIKTRNKLGIAQYAARYDISNAQLRLRRTRVEVLTGVRTAYYRLLAARESLKIYEALVRFTDQAYRIQVEQLKGGQAAAYEPMQLRSLSTIARAEFARARTRHDGAWRQLAAAVSVPDLPVGDIPEDANTPVPRVKYDEAVAYMLSMHPDLAAASNSVMQAHTNLELACVTPFPDVNFYTAIQRDFTDPNTRRHTFNMQVGLPVPIWDRNQGNIQSAQAMVVRTSHENTRLRNELVTKLADAFQRFDSANIVVNTYKDQVIPDLSRVYRSVYERHQQEPDVVGFGDIVVAQQTLLQAITQYAVALGERWGALVEILELMQVEDLGQLQVLESGVATPGE